MAATKRGLLALLAIAHAAAGSRVALSQQRLRVRGGASAHAIMSDAPPKAKAAPIVDSKNAHGLRTITLTHPKNGDSTTIYTFGACVTSYLHDGVESLKVRVDSKMDGSKPISGGIPHCFPQFGPGEIQQHGFARNLEWELHSSVQGPEPAICLRLVDSEKTRAMWPHKFEALYTVTLAADRLKTSLRVTNSDSAPWAFTAALHTYFDISAVGNLAIHGNFQGATFTDKTANPPVERIAESNEVRITRETDSVYKGVSGELLLLDTGKGTRLAVQATQGWRDTVLWNPYGNEGMGYNSFVCAEAALAAFPLTLAPHSTWTGAMDLVPSKL